MGYRYAVLGSGRQGTASAYDLACLGDADFILMADMDQAQAAKSVERVNRLIGREVAHPAALDVRDSDAAARLLTGNQIEVFISGVPYFHNLDLAHAAIRARASMCDFGGNTDLVRQQLALDAEAKAAGVTLIPDCGQVPGLGTSLCAYVISLFDDPRDIIMYDGGIPAEPKEPWNYILTFNIEGLTNEYFGTTFFLREGKKVEMPCFLEYELVDFGEPIGTLEAFTTAGGTSTMPDTFLGKVRTLQNKTIRWQGHYAQWKAFNDAGLISLDPIEVDGVSVVPRQVLHALLGPQLYAKPGDKDLVIVRVIGRGVKDGQEREFILDLFDHLDPSTGFTAMERTTGWHAAIMAGLMARGRVAKGGVPVELAVPGAEFMDELRKRGFDIKETWS